MNDGRRTTLPVDVTLTINDLPPKTAMRRIRRQIGAAGLVTRRDWWVLWLITASVVAVNLAQSVDIAALRHDVHRLQHSHVAPPAAVPSPGPVGSMSPRPRVSPSAASRSRTEVLTVQPSVTVDYPTAGQWAALRWCESRGNYADKFNPTYRGAYQFDRSTWASVGGHGDPADASPVEQDARARTLYAQRGSQPWPYCGRFL